MGRYLDIVKKFEARQQVRAPIPHQEPDLWRCPECSGPATINDIDWSLDGERQLTFWSCEACQIIAVDPNCSAREGAS